MKVCLSWLEEWLGSSLDPRMLADQLTMAGLEVDKLDTVAAAVTDVVVARVRRIESHPNADRLKICFVDDGSDKLLQVVCGAANVREGMYAPLARIGAQLGEIEIERAELRGVTSHGMLCSAQELGLDEDASGLMELDGEVAVGTNVAEYLHLNDMVLDLDLTPNRADCFSIAGVAREVAAMQGEYLKPPRQHTVSGVHSRIFPLQVREPAACPCYLARIVHNIKDTARTPLWMKERLRRSGIRALHPVVDVMNYVMMELGQPMHAFDLDRLQGHVEVRYAQDGELIELLDGSTTELQAETLLVADERAPIALAGIIGGAASAVRQGTRNVLIECAFFTPEALLGKARKYALHTEASLRFERGVDPQLQLRAMERACELLAQIVGGEFGPVNQAAEPVRPRQRIPLRYTALVKRLGVEIDHREVSKMLTCLGCRVKSCKGGWYCTPPSYRFDLDIEEDLIEEVGRLYGYDKIVAPPAVMTMRARQSSAVCHERDDLLCRRLVERGYLEVVTYSFVDPDWLAMVSDEAGLTLSNAVSPAMSVMRTSLWPGLLKTLRHNLNRQQERIRIFELGRCFSADNEYKVLAGLAYGDAYPEQWGLPRRASDFYDVKGDLESLLQMQLPVLWYERSSQRGLHPGCAAELLLDGEHLGYIGALDPAVTRRLDIRGDVFVFELKPDALPPDTAVRTQETSRYPWVRRDISVTVPADVNVAQIRACIRGAGY